MRCAVLSGLVLFGLLAGCASRPPPKPLVPDPVPAAPIAGEEEVSTASDHNDAVPRVIRRLVREQKDELNDVMSLVAVVGDARGRARALNEATSIATELGEIEGTLDNVDSDGLDQSVTRLLRLESKIEVLHDALRVANPEPGAPKGFD